MPYNGLEIDMLDVGNADCILVTRWDDGTPTRILIDGGNKKDSDDILLFLRTRDAMRIDHLVCSHPHDDHAGGLVDIVSDSDIYVGTAWVHLPEQHVDKRKLERALYNTYDLKKSQSMIKSLKTSNDLIDAIYARRIPYAEPFQGQEIGFLTVCGPTEDYYELLLDQFTDIDNIKKMDALYNVYETTAALEDLVKSASSGVLSDIPITSPENNSSVILATSYKNRKFLFTADAGADALKKAIDIYDLGNCKWMQLPHHGSRRNITQDLIEHFSPDVAFVSAIGDKKHPNKAVVNAIKKEGTKVYSTHYSKGGNKWHHEGDVPERPSYKNATPLWEDDE